ncbi:MAG TPA: 23S rRNA (uracil(1939)-C(5))-methyltransferase RlmD [Casimicrobiaceae bacterium]|nr:23S rRNA (uracil(1939)-C(5))-methyltransferase RlmD [Casimicrobiaceae bacterium]
MIRADVVALDFEGRGVARIEGKTVFVEGALPGETAAIAIVKRKPSFDLARATAIERAAPDRVAPRCPHFGACGGCTLQHATLPLQVAAKQRTLEDALARIGRVKPALLAPPLHGPAWGYRTRARLSVRHVPKKGGVLVGFHERKSSYVADMRECHVLPPRVSDLLPLLRDLVAGLSIRDRLPQIEVAQGARADDPSREHLVLVLRVLDPPTPADEASLRAFAARHAVSLWLQPGGPGSAAPLDPADPGLAYELREFALVLPFSPTEFTQVNPGVNEALVRRAIALVDPREGERAADFFCGLGNFTLPIARRGANVIGIEGSEPLVARARANASRNGLAERASFAAANLFAATPASIAPLLPLDKVLIDPPREGAVELVKALPSAAEDAAPRRIVYVSCNPATLARDAAVLVHEQGYVLASAGVVNMFPHTAHVESLALFVRDAAGA